MYSSQILWLTLFVNALKEEKGAFSSRDAEKVDSLVDNLIAYSGSLLNAYRAKNFYEFFKTYEDYTKRWTYSTTSKTFWTDLVPCRVGDRLTLSNNSRIQVLLNVFKLSDVQFEGVPTMAFPPNISDDDTFQDVKNFRQAAAL